MQRQKTIAKWLSVVLLTTIAIASYVLLNAIGKTPDNDRRVSSAGQNQTSDNTSEQPQKIFSAFPRKNEIINDIKVAHTGGSENENVLDYTYFKGKTVVFFKSESSDRDVKEAGLYIAVFANDSLESTIKIADENAIYLTSCLCQNGLLIFLKHEGTTQLLLLGNEYKIGARSYTDAYEQILPLSSCPDTVLVCATNDDIRIVSIDAALNVTRDVFVYQTPQPNIENAFYSDGKVLIFLQSQEGFSSIYYEQNKGFNRTFCDNKSQLLQTIPIVASNKQNFVTLSKTDDGVRLDAFDQNLCKLTQYGISDVEKAVMLLREGGIDIIADNAVYAFCSHLDFSGKSAIGNNFSHKDYSEYYAINGARNCFIAKTVDGFALLEYTDKNIDEIFCAEHANVPLVGIANGNENTVELSLFFDTNAKNEFSYMCFGKSDVFYLSLTMPNS